MPPFHRSRSGRLWTPEAPHLITRPHRRVGIVTPKTLLAGYFTWELVHARTRDVVRRAGPYRNLITDAGLDIIQAMPFGNALTYVRVGTGSNAPAVGDTALQTPLAFTNSNGGFADVSGVVASDYWRLSRTRVFTTAEANGNLTELGFSNTSSSSLFTRQLFLDELGDPTVVVKTNEFELRIVYEVRVLFDNTDEVQSVDINAVPQNVTRRRAAGWTSDAEMASGAQVSAHGVRGPAAALAAAGSDPTGGALVTPTTIGYAAYTPGNFFRDAVTLWSAAVANGVNYNVVVLGNFNNNVNGARRWGFLLPVNITKDNTQRFAIEHTVLWGRETPGS